MVFFNTIFGITLLLRFQFGSCLVRIPFRCMFAYLSAHQSSSSSREPSSQTGSLFRARNGMCFFYQFYLGNEEHNFFCLGEYSDSFVFFVGSTAAPVRIPGFPAVLIYIYMYIYMYIYIWPYMRTRSWGYCNVSSVCFFCCCVVAARCVCKNNTTTYLHRIARRHTIT